MSKINNNQIARAIYLASKGKTGHELSVSLKNSVQMLARRRLLSQASAILSKLGKIINFENKIVSAKLSSAHHLDSDTKHGIRQFLEKRYHAKDVNFTEEINDKLLGGFRLEANDEVIDLTTKNKIRKLQEHLEQI